MRRVSDNLFLLFLLLLPLQTVYLLREPIIGGGKWQYGTIGIYASSAVLAFAVLLGAMSKLGSSGASSFKDRVYALWIGRRSESYMILFVLWAGISVVWASDRVLALSGFVILLLAADAFVMTRDMVRRGMKDRILTVLILAAVIQALIGMWQFLAQETFSSTLLGTSLHPVWQAGTSVLKNGSGRWLRAYGTFPHPNVYGLFVAVGLLLVIVSINGSVGVERNADRNRKRRLFLLATLPILSLGLLVSFSRIAWGGLAAGYMAWAAYTYFADHRDDVRRYLVAVMVALSVSAFILCWALRDTVFPRFDGAIIAQERSVTDRMMTYRDAFRIIRESPMFGVGMWNSTAELIRLDPGRTVWDIQPVHDVPLLVLTELGIPGLILASLVAFRFFLISVRQKDIASLAMLLVFVPSLFLDHFLWDSVFGILFLFATLGAFIVPMWSRIRNMPSSKGETESCFRKHLAD